jgi:hypothetical protein
VALPVIRATGAEMEAHASQLETIAAASEMGVLWQQIESE